MRFSISRKLLEVETTKMADLSDGQPTEGLRWSHEVEDVPDTEEGSESESAHGPVTSIQDSILSTAELETSKLELTLARSELEFYRKRFWCVPCGGVPVSRCFDQHQILLQDITKEKLQEKVRQLFLQNESNKRVLVHHLSEITQLKQRLAATESDIRASVRNFNEILVTLEETALKLALETEDFGRSPSGISTSELEQLQDERFLRSVEVFNRFEAYRKILDNFQDLSTYIKDLLVKYPAQLNKVDTKADNLWDFEAEPANLCQAGTSSPERAAASSLSLASGFQVGALRTTRDPSSSEVAALEEPMPRELPRKKPRSSLRTPDITNATGPSFQTSSLQPMNCFQYPAVLSTSMQNMTLLPGTSTAKLGTTVASYPRATTAFTRASSESAIRYSSTAVIESTTRSTDGRYSSPYAIAVPPLTRSASLGSATWKKTDGMSSGPGTMLQDTLVVDTTSPAIATSGTAAVERAMHNSSGLRSTDVAEGNGLSTGGSSHTEGTNDGGVMAPTASLET